MRSGSSRYAQAGGLLSFEWLRFIPEYNPFGGWARDLCRFEEDQFYWARNLAAPSRSGAHAPLSRGKIGSKITSSPAALSDFSRIRGYRRAHQRHSIANSRSRYRLGLREDSL